LAWASPTQRQDIRALRAAVEDREPDPPPAQAPAAAPGSAGSVRGPGQGETSRDLQIYEQRMANLELARRVKSERAEARRRSREREEELRTAERHARREQEEFGAGLTLALSRGSELALARMPRGGSVMGFPSASVCSVCSYALAEPTLRCEGCGGQFHRQCCAQAPPGYQLTILCGYCFQEHYARMRDMREERGRAALATAQAASSAVVRTAAQAGALTGLAVATGARVVQACRAGFQCGAQVGWAAGGAEVPVVGPAVRQAVDVMGSGQPTRLSLEDGGGEEEWQEAEDGEEDLPDPWEAARRTSLPGGWMNRRLTRRQGPKWNRPCARKCVRRRPGPVNGRRHGRRNKPS